MATGKVELKLDGAGVLMTREGAPRLDDKGAPLVDGDGAPLPALEMWSFSSPAEALKQRAEFASELGRNAQHRAVRDRLDAVAAEQAAAEAARERAARPIGEAEARRLAEQG